MIYFLKVSGQALRAMFKHLYNLSPIAYSPEVFQHRSTKYIFYERMAYTVTLNSNVKRIHAETLCLPFLKERTAAIALVKLL